MSIDIFKSMESSVSPCCPSARGFTTESLALQGWEEIRCFWFND